MWFLHVAGSGVWVNVGRTLHLPGARQLEAEGNRAAQKVVVLFSCTIGRSAKKPLPTRAARHAFAHLAIRPDPIPDTLCFVSNIPPPDAAGLAVAGVVAHISGVGKHCSAALHRPDHSMPDLVVSPCVDRSVRGLRTVRTGSLRLPASGVPGLGRAARTMHYRGTPG